MIMMPLAGVSRRALVAAAAAAAVVASEVSARKRQKPPLAFVMAQLGFFAADSLTTFRAIFDAAFTYPVGPNSGNFSNNIIVASQVSPDQLRKLLVAELQKAVAHQLALLGRTVPADRIAVTLV